MLNAGYTPGVYFSKPYFTLQEIIAQQENNRSSKSTVSVLLNNYLYYRYGL